MTSKQILITSLGIAAIFFFIFVAATEMYIYSVLGISLFLFFGVKLFFGLGREIEVRDLMILLTSLQWIIGPLLSFYFFPDNPIFYMAVDEYAYMDFVFPATLALAVGLYLPFWRKPENEQFMLDHIKALLKRYPQIDLILIVTGSLAEIFSEYSPFGHFFAFLLASTRFVGLYFLLVNDRPYKWWIFGAVIIWFLSISVSQAMFHDLILWLGFMIMIIAFIYKFSIAQRLIYGIAFLVIIFLIQTIKQDIRSMAYRERDLNAFSETITETAGDTEFLFSEVNLEATVYRINQGWIIARILNYMPAYEPFAQGETIWQGLYESIVPRPFLKRKRLPDVAATTSVLQG